MERHSPKPDRRTRNRGRRWFSLLSAGSILVLVAATDPGTDGFREWNDLHDRRFEPVGAEELDGLEVELTLLSTPGPIASWRNIVIGKHGIVLYKGRNRAVYLPHVATEQGWDLEETLTHLARKAGLPPDGWRDGARFEVFEGQVFAEGHQEGDSHGH